MPTIPLNDVEIRLYDRITGERLPLDPDRLTGDVSVELTEAGGVDTIKATLSRPFDADDAPPLGCLVDVIVHGDPVPAGQWEPFPRWRGILAAPESQLDLAETFSLFAYGLLEDMSRVPLDGTIAGDGEKTDLAQLAAKALDFYVAARPWLAGRYERLIENTGVERSLVTVDDGDCRGAMDAIANEAPGLIVWGWRVSPETGAFQFVFRARTETVGYRVAVGENVQRYNTPEELAKVQNEALLSGGPSDAPNILGVITGNATFARAENRGAQGANLLSDPDFDNRTDATLSGGASYKAGSLSEGPTFSGSSMVELDNAGERVRKHKDDIAASLPPVGKPISIVVRHRREVGTDTRTATANFYWRQSGARMPGGPHASIALAPDTSGYWPEAKFTAARLAGADGVEVEVVAGGGAGGILIGYLSVYDAGRLVPSGWDCKAFGDAVFNVIDPLYPLAWPGNPGVKTSLRLSVSAADTTGEDAHLETIGQATGPCSGNQTVTLVFRARRTPGSVAPTGKMQALFKSYRGNGEKTNELSVTIPAGTFGDAWQEWEADFTVDDDAETVTSLLLFRGNTDLLISCIQLRDASVGTEFIRGANWERIIRASEICDPGSPAALSASVYDVRFGRVTNASLKKWDAGAQAWAKAYLTQQAVPPKRARLSLIHEAVQRIDPLDGVLLRLLGTDRDVPDEYPSRVSYRFGPALGVDVELGGESPTLQRLLAGGKDRQNGAVSAGGSGGASVSSGSGSINDSINGVAGEVAAARSSAGLGAFDTLDARLEAMETATGISVPKATSTTTGTVKTDVDQADPVVVTKATYDANKAATDATTAEVIAARTEATTAPFTGQVFANLGFRLNSIVTRLAALYLRAINTSGGIQGGGNLTGDLSLSLTNTGVSPGSYTNLNATIDAKGRVTAASNGTAGSGSGNPAYVDGAPYSSLPSTPVDVTKFDSTYFTTTDLGASGTTANQRKVEVSLRSDVIPAPRKLWYGYVDISDRINQNALLTGISPQLAPGLVVGDYLIIGSDYTGTSRDPYAGVVGGAAAPLLNQVVMSPIFFQIYAAIRDLNPILVTATVASGAVPRTGTKIRIHKPEGLLGNEGGRALVEIDPESVSSYGTYIFRIVRITSVPSNPAQAYSGDIYELGFTLNEALTLSWGAAPPVAPVSSGQFSSNGTYIGGPDGITPFIYRAGRQERRSPIASGSSAISVTLEAPGSTVAGGPAEKRIEELLIEVSANGTITITIDVRQFYNPTTNQCCDIYLRLTGSGNVVLQGPAGLGHTINNAASVTIGGAVSVNKVYRLTPYNVGGWWGYISA